MKAIRLQWTDQRLVELARALGHPARVRIVRLLAQRDSCICGELVDELPLAQATVSQHLKVLKDAGIIAGRVQGPAVCYWLVPQALAELDEAVGELYADSGLPQESIAKTQGDET